jgi:SAM-dependent methyltransferase
MSTTSPNMVRAMNRVKLVPTQIDMVVKRRRPGGQFVCPGCGFTGRFVTSRSITGNRPYAMCPQCKAAERHRLQSLVLDLLMVRHDFSKLSVLHIAPEAALKSRLRNASEEYLSGDLVPVGVDLTIDLTRIDQPNERYDVVYASHVLEHVKDDIIALGEIVRVLRPGGFAVLPVPIVADTTIEYQSPVWTEAGHVRAPGPEYYDRYRKVFSRVDLFTSGDFDEKYQTWVYEDRSRYPTNSCPYRKPVMGARHIDIVPVAYK